MLKIRLSVVCDSTEEEEEENTRLKFMRAIILSNELVCLTHGVNVSENLKKKWNNIRCCS